MWEAFTTSVRVRGGEQGTLVMPMLFSLGQHAALTAIAERLEDGERFLAFLDDLYVVTTPQRSVAVHDVLREELWRMCTMVRRALESWGVVPDRCDELEAAARAVNPRARVWRGSHEPSNGNLLRFLQTTARYSPESRKFRICSAHGCCCSIVEWRERTSTFAPFAQS